MGGFVGEEGGGGNESSAQAERALEKAASIAAAIATWIFHGEISLLCEKKCHSRAHACAGLFSEDDS
jgi:hypothetical protein